MGDAVGTLTQQRNVESLKAELEAFEARFGVPSERLTEAFVDEAGALNETDDFRRWSTIWAAWRACRTLTSA